MTRYTVDLEELLQFADRLEKFTQRADEIERAIDQQINELHSTWLGVGADAQKEYHRVWMTAAREMREAVAKLRQDAEIAHRNYTGVGEHNAAMWP